MNLLNTNPPSYHTFISDISASVKVGIPSLDPNLVDNHRVTSLHALHLAAITLDGGSRQPTQFFTNHLFPDFQGPESWEDIGPEVSYGAQNISLFLFCQYQSGCPAFAYLSPLAYTVHCTLNTVHCTLYTVHCTLYTVQCTLYTVHCTLYTAHYILHTVHYILYTIHYTLYTVEHFHCQWTSLF